jgi:hypothetical protein
VVTEEDMMAYIDRSLQPRQVSRTTSSVVSLAAFLAAFGFAAALVLGLF